MDIRSGCGYPGTALSNFAPHLFVFDDVECKSMEGLLQAFKFDKHHIQVEVCLLVGKAAKFRGKARNKTWQRMQTLWWKGVAYGRGSPEYQALLDRAFKALYTQNESYRKALAATQKAVITHSIGKNKEADTVLTERELCSRLMKLRDKVL
jgi:Bacteriophage protein GP30.3